MKRNIFSKNFNAPIWYEEYNKFYIESFGKIPEVQKKPRILKKYYNIFGYYLVNEIINLVNENELSTHDILKREYFRNLKCSIKPKRLQKILFNEYLRNEEDYKYLLNTNNLKMKKTFEELSEILIKISECLGSKE